MSVSSLSGIVESFDKDRGIGFITSGTERFIFHCVEIADGSRDIAVAAKVSFVVVVRFDVREASRVEKI